MKLISVIIPIYNTQKYLKKCIDSVESQSYNNIEIILVNDGSTDSSEKIIRPYLQKYENIKYYKKENGGLSDARNYGMPYATGEYIAFLDSDDYVESTMYEEMYEGAKKENADMVECDFIWEYPDKRKEDIGTIYKSKKEMIEKYNEK